MSFIAKSHPERDEVASGSEPARSRPPAAGDTYLHAMLDLIELAVKNKVNTTLIDQARSCATKRNQAGLILALEMLRRNCDELRKCAAAIENKIASPVEQQVDADLKAIADGDFEAATQVYGNSK